MHTRGQQAIPPDISDFYHGLWHKYPGGWGGIHDTIIARDWPLFVELWNYVSQGLLGQLNCSILSKGLDANNLENTDRVASGANGPLAKGIPEGREPTLMQVMAVENIGEASSLQVMTEENEGECSSRLAHPDLEVSQGVFSSAQKRDPTLKNAWQQVIINGGRKKVSPLGGHWLAAISGYRG